MPFPDPTNGRGRPDGPPARSALAVGGCATRTSNGWAQTAPAIPPSQSGEETIRLGAVSEPVALHESAEDPVAN